MCSNENGLSRQERLEEPPEAKALERPPNLGSISAPSREEDWWRLEVLVGATQFIFSSIFRLTAASAADGTPSPPPTHIWSLALAGSLRHPHFDKNPLFGCAAGSADGC